MKISLRNWTTFLVVQVLFLMTAVAFTYARYVRIEQDHALPSMRNVPLEVLPEYDDPRVVTDEQLLEVLYKLRPRLRHPQSQINHIDHALRFWGIEAAFDDPECLSGVEMREILLDHNKFVEIWGEKAPPFLINDETGVRVRTMEGGSSASHHDHTLGGLAEVGTTLDHPIVTVDGEGTVRDMLLYTLRNFHLNQIEYEWSTLAFLLYLPPVDSWRTEDGQIITFDRLADRIMRQKWNQGVCMGNHRLHALVMMLRIDDQIPILTDDGRQRIIDHLMTVAQTLVASQHPSGYWIRSWSDGVPPVEGVAGDSENTIGNRILATGHILEWLALAPEEVHPPRQVIVRAGQWLTRAILDLDDRSVKQQYTFLTHAGRALALWRGHFPAYFIDKMRASELTHAHETTAEVIESSEPADESSEPGESTDVSGEATGASASSERSDTRDRSETSVNLMVADFLWYDGLPRPSIAV